MRPAQKVLVTLANRQQRAAVRNFNGQMGVAGVNALAHGAARSLDELNPLMRVLAQSLATNALPKRELRETNQKIAENARAAMARYYATMLPERSSHYRPQDRLVGALGRALRDPSMTERTTDRVISFINPRMMDDTAKHWARVNYGVAGALTQGPSREAATFTVSVGGQKLMTLRDPNKPRPGGVYLPERFRWDGRKMVVLRGPATARPGRGARAAHFTDLGFASVAHDIGPAYEQLLRWYVTQGRSQKKFARRAIVVPDLRMLPNGAWTVRVT